MFEGLDIWKDEKYQKLQGSFPVIFLFFANVKEKTYQSARERICQILVGLYAKNNFLREAGILERQETDFFESVNMNMNDNIATMAIHKMCDFLQRYYGKRVIVLLDEYDTPMQEAYVEGYWEEFTAFMRNLFHAAFKTNPYLERAIMTGITRVSRESVFSDLNNLEVVTTTSEKYRECFGLTEEVFAVLDEYNLNDFKADVKDWYDGFTFVSTKHD